MKATLITGASCGIGEEFARQLAAQGHNLVLVARSEKKLHQLCDELMLAHKITAHYIPADLSSAESIQKILDETDRHGFEIDWLINNAGFGSMGDFTELDLGRETEMIRLNIEALVALTHTYLLGMRSRQKGVVINVASTASFQPVPFMATYAATKAFVTSFSEALAEENRPFGIVISALCPGPTATNFFAAANAFPFAEKGVQTSEQVVAAALRGVQSGKSKKISGFTNALGAFLGQHLPNRIVAGAIARYLRSKIKERN